MTSAPQARDIEALRASRGQPNNAGVKWLAYGRTGVGLTGERLAHPVVAWTIRRLKRAQR